VSKDDPPFLIMHGDDDSTVPVQQSEAFAEAPKLEPFKNPILSNVKRNKAGRAPPSRLC
jgi:hypothetical protein